MHSQLICNVFMFNAWDSFKTLTALQLIPNITFIVKGGHSFLHVVVSNSCKSDKQAWQAYNICIPKMQIEKLSDLFYYVSCLPLISTD